MEILARRAVLFGYIAEIHGLDPFALLQAQIDHPADFRL
jgi:hypothetical protein